MGPGETIGLVALVVLAITTLGLLADAYKRRLQLKERELELFAGQTAEKAAQYAAQSERIEARVRVLERLATDRGGKLALEIENLRDRQVN